MAEVDYENTDLTEVDSVPRYGWLVHAASIMNASSTFIAFSSRHECSLPTRTTVSLGGSQTLNILYNVRLTQTTRNLVPVSSADTCSDDTTDQVDVVGQPGELSFLGGILYFV